MKLPSSDRAIVPQAKITAYLLSEEHPVGRHKAAFFHHFGYALAEWQRLAADLLQHGLENEVGTVEDSPFGTRYVVEGIIHAPDGRDPRIKSAWFIEHGEEVPHLVTAYPAG
jgi:hypothetical protein